MKARLKLNFQVKYKKDGDKMSYEDRKKLYKEIIKERKNPLIVYVTSIRPNLSSQMASDAIPYVTIQREKSIYPQNIKMALILQKVFHIFFSRFLSISCI